MDIQHTDDYELVRRMLVQPELWRRMVNDSAPDPAMFHVTHSETIRYVLATDQGQPVGIFLLCKRPNPATAEVHFCLTPEVWGRSSEAVLAFVQWVWRETGLMRLIGPVPAYNRLALKLAGKCGFREYHRAYEAVRKHMVPYELIYTEIERPQQ